MTFMARRIPCSTSSSGVLNRCSWCRRRRRHAVPAVEEVVAGQSGQRVVAVVAGERIVVRRADEILDADVGVAFRVAAGPLAGGEARNDAGCGGEVARRVVTCAAVEKIGTRAADDIVIAAE